MAGDYERLGDKPHTVLALHGWFGSATAWTVLRPHLNGSEFSYVLLNYRGYGTRKGITGEYSIAESARNALAVAENSDSRSSPWWGTRWAAA